MPSPYTFQMQPIKELLSRFCLPGFCVVDPFSGNSKYGTITNDINPDTAATSHKDAVEFLESLVREKVSANVLLIDPPYSPRQMKECYSRPGLGRMSCSTSLLMSQIKKTAVRLMKAEGIVISFGWNSNGMGFPFIKEEIQLIAHGASHNDTIVVIERLPTSEKYFDNLIDAAPAMV